MLLSHLIRFFHERRRFRKNLQELRNLSDRELHDIGISRSDIYRVAVGYSDR